MAANMVPRLLQLADTEASGSDQLMSYSSGYVGNSSTPQKNRHLLNIVYFIMLSVIVSLYIAVCVVKSQSAKSA